MIQPTGNHAATFIRPRWSTGRYYTTTNSVARGTLALTLDRLFLVPFDVPLGAKIDRLGCEVSTAIASGVARLGVYRSTADGLPGSLLLDAGTVDCSTTGGKEITLGSALSLPDGRVFLALAPQVAAATFRTMSTGHDPRIGASALTSATASNGQNAYYATSSVSGAFPVTVGAPSTATHGPVIAVRAAP